MQHELRGGPAYQDRAFIERLDVTFANLYFEGVTASLQGGNLAPPAWRPLFESRGERRARIQHALAGMNAHINRDLPLALVQTFQEVGGTPADAGPRRADFDRVNDLLQRVETQVKAEFAIGLVGLADVAAGTLDDVLAMWRVGRARDAAWTNAEVLWALPACRCCRCAISRGSIGSLAVPATACGCRSSRRGSDRFADATISRPIAGSRRRSSDDWKGGAGSSGTHRCLTSVSEYSGSFSPYAPARLAADVCDQSSRSRSVIGDSTVTIRRVLGAKSNGSSSRIVSPS